MSIERKPDSAVLFRDEEKTNEKAPDFTGQGLIGGTNYRLAAWINESQAGKKYFSIKFEEPRQKPVESKPAAADTDLDEDVPF